MFQSGKNKTKYLLLQVSCFQSCFQLPDDWKHET